MNNESKNKYISSRGLMKSCDFYSIKPISSIKLLYGYVNFGEFIIKNRKENRIPIIYICSSALKDFINRMLIHINFKFILLSGDCDEDMPNDVLNEKELNNFCK